MASRRICALNNCMADGKCEDPSASFYFARDDKVGQKLATSLDFSCRESLSAIRAMNSEFVVFVDNASYTSETDIESRARDFRPHILCARDLYDLCFLFLEIHNFKRECRGDHWSPV